MQTKLIFFFGFISLLFLSPIVANSIYNVPKEEVVKEEQVNEKLVYAPKTDQESINLTEQTESNSIDFKEQTKLKKVLMLFTHSHEAFIPIVKSENGEKAVYHPNSNISEFEEIIQTHFKLNSMDTNFLGVDTMDELKKTNRTFSEAYDVVRPFLSKEIKNNPYDLIVDLHRDSASREISTLTYNNQTYGKLYFVVGEEHPNFLINKSYAQQISDELNKLIPGISRGVIGKKGEHVDGIYNQDLANNMVLIELGGIENTQEEINRTISVLAKATSVVLQDSAYDK